MLSITLLFLCSCSYLCNRADDAMDMVDVGFTFSTKPGIAVWYDFVPVVPIGISYVDGYFVGLGGGGFRFFSHHFQRHFGLVLWGQEEVTFRYSKQDLDDMTNTERDEATNFQRTGLIGMIQGPFPGPDYLISCPHYLHIGWIGAVASPRYLQMLDFIIGWTTLDICFDDDWEQEE